MFELNKIVVAIDLIDSALSCWKRFVTVFHRMAVALIVFGRFRRHFIRAASKVRTVARRTSLKVRTSWRSRSVWKSNKLSEKVLLSCIITLVKKTHVGRVKIKWCFGVWEVVFSAHFKVFQGRGDTNLSPSPKPYHTEIM